MSRYNLCIRLSAVASTGPVMDFSGVPVNQAEISNVSPSSLFSASPGHTIMAAPRLETEPSDDRVAGLGEKNLESGDNVNADNPFVENT